MELSTTGMRGGAHPPTPPPASSPPPRPTGSGADRAAALETLAAIERTAWFDLNGDGRITNQSALFGGDGYLIGDGNLDGHLDRGRETWYDARGRPVPPPPPGAGEVTPPPPVAPPPRADTAKEVVAQVYRDD